MKRGNKRGQFYLIAAITIVTVIVVLASMSSHVKKKNLEDHKNLGRELEIESEKVLDYITKTGADKDKALENFTKDFESYAGQGSEIYYIHMNESEYIGYSYVNGLQTPITLSNDSVKIYTTIDSNTYDFNLEKGRNFYFVIMHEETDGEIHIVKN